MKYGDTLSGIAERTLGAQGRYSVIYEANRDRMSNPNQLVPGKVLRIPRTASVAGVR
ncbi:MAG: LysM peptidoglycan-binding domain-containing protein [Planctomyces sp.]